MQGVIDLSPVYPHVMLGLLVAARLGGLFLFAPIISSEGIPAQVKVALLLALTAAGYPAVLPTVLAVNPQALALPTSLLELAPLVAMEVLVGTIIGFVAAIPMMAAQFSGVITGQQMGLDLAQEYDPTSGVDSNVLSHLLYYLAIIGFLMLGGGELIVLAVLRSFETVPLGGFRADQTLLDWVAALLGAAFSLALRLSAPVLCMMLLESVAMGFINKTAQAFNIMSLGFPLRVILGFVLVIITLQMVNDVILDDTPDLLDDIFVYFEHWGR